MKAKSHKEHVAKMRAEHMKKKDEPKKEARAHERAGEKKHERKEIKAKEHERAGMKGMDKKPAREMPKKGGTFMKGGGMDRDAHAPMKMHEAKGSEKPHRVVRVEHVHYHIGRKEK